MTPVHDHPHRPSADSPDWYRAAACREVDVSVFYPADNDRGVLAARRVQRAKQICQTCPVIRVCLTVALTTDERYGIWGGLTPNERAGLELELGQQD
jgi:WhiB family redox-sensing transcriptional regulator